MNSNQKLHLEFTHLSNLLQIRYSFLLSSPPFWTRMSITVILHMSYIAYWKCWGEIHCSFSFINPWMEGKHTPGSWLNGLQSGSSFMPHLEFGKRDLEFFELTRLHEILDLTWCYNGIRNLGSLVGTWMYFAIWKMLITGDRGWIVQSKILKFPLSSVSWYTHTCVTLHGKEILHI